MTGMPSGAIGRSPLPVEDACAGSGETLRSIFEAARLIADKRSGRTTSLIPENSIVPASRSAPSNGVTATRAS